MTHERKADDTNSLEHAAADKGEPFARVAFQLWSDVWTLDEDGGHDDHHPDEREAGCAREFVDIPVERQWKRDTERAEGDHELAFGEE